MRRLVTLFAALALAAPLAMAGTNDANPKKEDAPAAKSAPASTAASKPAAPAAKTDAPAKPESSATESEVNELRSLVQQQSQELEAQRAALAEQQKKMQALEEKLSGNGSAQPGAEVGTAVAAPALAVSPMATAPGANPAITPPASAGSAPATLAAAAKDPQAGGEEASPLQFRIGSAYITPVGFMDFTGVWRSHDGGSGIGTNFAGIPYGNVFQNNLSEFRLSMQNSRIGFRVDAMVKGAHVIGYMESDYLGNNPGNVAVSSNSNTLRSRLYWVDVAKDKWEILGGQTWSLITPGRTGISPLPGNIFFSQNIDVNYQAGLVWGRIPELRFVFHPSSKAALAFALDSPEQYAGGSAGGATITYPAGLTALGGTQLDTGGTTVAAPNLAPDIIAKVAIDPVSKFHFEFGGVERQFKLWNPTTGVTSTKTGGGVFLNLNAEIAPGFRILTNNFWSDGGGRYIFGQVPDVIVHANGSPSPIHSGSTVSGFEFTHKNTLLYAYYGGIYTQKNVALDTNGTSFIGYGYAGSPSAQNRMVQEETFGLSQTVWKDAKYGALNLMGQFSYLNRNPWAIISGQPSDAHLAMMFFNLRYTLPGSAPAMK